MLINYFIMYYLRFKNCSIDYSMVELKRRGVGQITPDEEML